MELTDNDKERIEHEIKNLMDKWGGFMPADQMLFKIAMYATRYEREQQIKTLNRPGFKYYVSYDPDYKDKVFGVFNKEDLTQQGAEKMAQQLNELEAERSELRNKVIEEAIEQLNSPMLNFSDGLIYKGTVIELLNSLKK